MEREGQTTGKIEMRLRQLGAKLDRLAARAGQATTEFTQDDRKLIDDAQNKRTTVQARLKAFRDGKGQKWDNFKAGVETAWYEFADALKLLAPKSDGTAATVRSPGNDNGPAA